jgi:cyclic-di-GMP-binding protein
MPSMDIVNKLDLLEVTTAVDQAKKEVAQRYDFKGTNTTYEFVEKDKTILLKSNSDDRVNAAFTVLMERLMKRNVSPKVLDRQKLEELPGGMVKQLVKLKDGIDVENAKAVVKIIKERFPKVTASINGDLVRASSKSRDELQDVIAHFRTVDLPVPLGFTNRRD